MPVGGGLELKDAVKGKIGTFKGRRGSKGRRGGIK